MLKKLLIIFTALSLILCLCGCNSNSGEEDEEKSEDVDLVSAGDELRDSIEAAVIDYFQALKSHNHQQLTECTTEDCVLNYNQTEFQDFVRYIEDFKIDEIEFDNISNIKAGYKISVRYTLVYSKDYSPENSGDEHYIYYDDFFIVNDNNKYKISEVQQKGVG